MTEIVPAVMPEDFDDLYEGLARVRSFAKSVQIDIMDGFFVPSKSWPYSEADHFAALVDQSEGLPFWEKLDFGIDLMVGNPQEVFDQWIETGATRITVHLNSLKDDIEFIRTKKAEGRVEIGLAVMPDVSLEKLAEYIPHIDYVQCMGISQIGFQGEPFNEEVLDTVKKIRQAYPDLLIAIDGGVSDETARPLVDAGANRLVSGSFILEADEPRDAYLKLLELVK